MPRAFKLPSGVSLQDLDPAKGVKYADQCTVIEGVVSPKGQGGWASAVKGCNIHCFTLSAWKFDGQAVTQRELTILRPVSPRTDNIFVIPDYSVQRLSVLLSRDETRAIVDKVFKLKVADAELRVFAEELQKPVVIRDKRFGELVLNPRVGWFEGKRSWNRKIVEVSFECGADNDITDAMKTAESLWAEQTVWKKKVNDFAVEKLLPLKNENWLQENEAKLSQKQFLSKMDLQSITVSEEGQFTFWHNDGGMFGGHSIEIAGSLTKGPTHADIPG